MTDIQANEKLENEKMINVIKSQHFHNKFNKNE